MSGVTRESDGIHIHGPATIRTVRKPDEYWSVGFWFTMGAGCAAGALWATTALILLVVKALFA